MAGEFKATALKVRVSARKARLVANLVRSKHVQEASDILKNCQKKSAPVILKLLNSAMAAADQKSMVDKDRLFVSSIYVDEGPTAKRFLPRAQGRATPIRKRSSHITVKLLEK